MFIYSFCSKLLIWVPVPFPSLLVHCIFFFISLCVAFTSSFILCLYSVISVSILITSVLNSASDCLAIFSWLSSFWSFDLFFHLDHIFLSWHTCYIVRGRVLGICQGWGNPGHCIVALSVGEGSEREQHCLLGCHLAFSHFSRYPQSDCALSGANSWVGGLLYVLGPCGSLQPTLLWG